MNLLTPLVVALALASPLLAHTYSRYGTPASYALAKEAALIAKGDTPEAARRYAIGDAPAVPWGSLHVPHVNAQGNVQCGSKCPRTLCG